MTSIIRGNDNFDSATVPAAIQGAKAWISMNMSGTQAIRSSYNVSSIADTGVGNTNVNFTTAFADTTYCITAIAGTTFASNPGDTASSASPNTTGQMMLEAVNSSGANVDPQYFAAAVFAT